MLHNPALKPTPDHVAALQNLVHSKLAQLREALLAIAVASDVTKSISTPFGTKYVVEGDLASPAGIRARVRTVWILETGEDLPRLVTAYPTGETDRGGESD